jgi:hypothetical protein
VRARLGGTDPCPATRQQDHRMRRPADAPLHPSSAPWAPAHDWLARRFMRFSLTRCLPGATRRNDRPRSPLGACQRRAGARCGHLRTGGTSAPAAARPRWLWLMPTRTNNSLVASRPSPSRPSSPRATSKPAVIGIAWFVRSRSCWPVPGASCAQACRCRSACRGRSAVDGRTARTGHRIRPSAPGPVAIASFWRHPRPRQSQFQGQQSPPIHPSASTTAFSPATKMMAPKIF